MSIGQKVILFVGLLLLLAPSAGFAFLEFGGDRLTTLLAVFEERYGDDLPDVPDPNEANVGAG